MQDSEKVNFFSQKNIMQNSLFKFTRLILSRAKKKKVNFLLDEIQSQICGYTESSSYFDRSTDIYCRHNRK